MTRAGAIAGDLRGMLGFFTRLPGGGMPRDGRRFADGFWAAPLAGLVVAGVGAGVFALGALLGIGAGVCAWGALAATALATGALHEDGLADVADGFGGGRTAERRLEIMRDSRIGAFGGVALAVSLGLRAALLGELAGRGGVGAVVVGLAAAEGASRAALPLFLWWVPPARASGLGVGASAVPGGAVAGALALGALCLAPLGFSGFCAGVAGLGGLAWAWRRVCLSQIGGQTGDACGALQQGAAVFVLLVAAAI